MSRVSMHTIAVEPQVHDDVQEILRSGRLTAGPFCARLEEAACTHLGGMSARYAYARVGTNARLSELQAAVALRAVEVLDADTTARTANADRLGALLAGVPGIVAPDQAPADGRRGCWHQYVVRVDPAWRGGRAALAAHLDGVGVDSDVVYPGSLSTYDVFADHPGVLVVDDTEARRAATEVLSLPVHRGLQAEDVDAIGAAVTAWAGA